MNCEFSAGHNSLLNADEYFGQGAEVATSKSIQQAICAIQAEHTGSDVDVSAYFQTNLTFPPVISVSESENSFR